MSLLEHTRRPGEVVGPWRIVRELGRGGWGTVYAAEQVHGQGPAALKILSPEVCKHRTAIERFRREARATSAIGHPNVVEIHDTGELPDGSAYYAMELLTGESLAETLRREGRLPWSRVQHIALQLCGALAAAHAKGIVHRDLKPANCFRSTRGDDHDYIKLLDFGIAKILSGEIGDLASLTNTGEFLGTTAFMAPEQVLGEKLDHRVDVHAMGVLMFLMLTGTLPFGGTVASQVVVAIVQNTAAPMLMVAPGAGISEAMEQIVARALAKEPRRRFQSVAELAAAIAAVKDAPAATVMQRGSSALAEAPTAMAGAVGVDALAATEGAPEEPRTVAYHGARRVAPVSEADSAALRQRSLSRVMIVLVVVLMGVAAALVWMSG